MNEYFIEITINKKPIGINFHADEDLEILKDNRELLIKYIMNELWQMLYFHEDDLELVEPID